MFSKPEELSEENSRDSTRGFGYSDESHRFFIIIILFFYPPLSVRLYYTNSSSSTRMMQPGQEQGHACQQITTDKVLTSRPFGFIQRLHSPTSNISSWIRHRHFPLLFSSISLCVPPQTLFSVYTSYNNNVDNANGWVGCNLSLSSGTDSVKNLKNEREKKTSFV